MIKLLEKLMNKLVDFVIYHNETDRISGQADRDEVTLLGAIDQSPRLRTRLTKLINLYGTDEVLDLIADQDSGNLSDFSLIDEVLDLVQANLSGQPAKPVSIANESNVTKSVAQESSAILEEALCRQGLYQTKSKALLLRIRDQHYVAIRGLAKIQEIASQDTLKAKIYFRQDGLFYQMINNLYQVEVILDKDGYWVFKGVVNNINPSEMVAVFNSSHLIQI